MRKHSFSGREDDPGSWSVSHLGSARSSQMLGLYSRNDLQQPEVMCPHPTKVKSHEGPGRYALVWTCTCSLITWTPDPFSVLLCVPRGCPTGVLCLCAPRQGVSVSGVSRRLEGQTRHSKGPFDHGRVTAVLNPQRPLPFPPRARKGVGVVVGPPETHRGPGSSQEGTSHLTLKWCTL